MPPPPDSGGCRSSVIRVTRGWNLLDGREGLEHPGHPSTDLLALLLAELQLPGDLVSPPPLLLEPRDALLRLAQPILRILDQRLELVVLLPQAANELGGALDALFQHF